MDKLLTRQRRLVSGVAMVEYAILLTFIALVSVLSIKAFTGKAVTVMNNVGDQMDQQSVVASEPVAANN